MLRCGTLSPRLAKLLFLYPRTGCWLYMGKRWSRNGYGRAKDEDGKERQIHRLVWEELRGPICPTIELDHLCRVRACSCPDHLDPVFPVVNTRRGEAKLFKKSEKYQR